MPLSVASGDTVTVESGTTTFASEVYLTGEINLNGQLTTDDARRSANGNGDGVGTALATPQASVSASGTGEGVALETEFDRLIISSGTTRNISSGEVLDTGTLDLAGEINVSGELQIEEAKPVALYGEFRSASGVGEGIGTVDALPRRFVSASGSGDGTGTAAVVVTSFQSATGIGEGVGSASALVRAFVSASGVGEGIGTADALPRRLVSAAGIGEATASNPTFVISIPLVRGNADNVEWHEDDDIDLGADSDGAL